MEFYDVLNQALILLEREKRVSYRALKRQFSIDDEYIEDLKAEVIDAKQLAVEADHGRRVGRQMEVGCPLVRHQLQQAVEFHGPDA